MAKHKYIYWRPDLQKNEKGELYANVHLLVGYNQGSIIDFQKMADEIIETFPQATYEQICGCQVTQSRFVKGFTLVRWDAFIPQGEYPDWHQFKEGKIEYSY